MPCRVGPVRLGPSSSEWQVLHCWLNTRSPRAALPAWAKACVAERPRRSQRLHLPNFSSRVSASSGRCRSMWDGLGRTQEASPVFTFEQSPLAPDAPAITRDRAVLFHDPVTRHHDRELVGGAGFADFASLARRSDAGRNLAVGRRRAGRDVTQGVPDFEFEGRTAQVQPKSPSLSGCSIRSPSRPSVACSANGSSTQSASGKRARRSASFISPNSTIARPCSDCAATKGPEELCPAA